MEKRHYISPATLELEVVNGIIAGSTPKLGIDNSEQGNSGGALSNKHSGGWNNIWDKEY